MKFKILQPSTSIFIILFHFTALTKGMKKVIFLRVTESKKIITIFLRQNR